MPIFSYQPKTPFGLVISDRGKSYVVSTGLYTQGKIPKFLPEYLENFYNEMSDEHKDRYLAIIERSVSLNAKNAWTLGESRDVSAIRILKEIVSDLYALLEDANVVSYVKRFIETIPIPEKLEHEVVNDRTQANRVERTYTVSQYISLCEYMAYLYFVLPIWSQFSSAFAKHYEYIEMKFIETLKRAAIVMDHPAYERLVTYMMASTDLRKNHDTAVVNMSLDPDQYYNYIVSKMIVERLVVINNHHPGSEFNKQHAVVVIFNHAQSLDQMGNTNRFGQAVHNRQLNGIGSEVGNKSVLDILRARGSHAPAMDVAAKVCLLPKFSRGIMLDIGFSNYDPNKLDRYIMHVELLESIEIQDVQVALTGWILAQAISPSLLYNIPQKNLLYGFAYAAYWLDEHGFGIVADYLLGKLLPGQAGGFVQIPSELYKEFNHEFPLRRRENKKQEGKNPAFDDVASLARELRSYCIEHPVNGLRASGIKDTNSAVYLKIIELAIYVAKYM